MTVLTGVISYPTPPYQNVPIHAEYFQPSQFFISAIALGTTTIVTTTVNTNYVIGQEVRLLIPRSFGSIELNGVRGYVLSLPSLNQVEISINSNVNVTQFILSTNLTQSAQIVAIGDINNGYTSTTGEVIPTINGNTQICPPGSFINISPI